MVLVAYDVNTETKEGRRRLRRVAKICEDYGQRVQNSVFECLVPYDLYIVFQNRLKETIDPKKDSLRFYRLGKNWKTKIESFGVDFGCDPKEDTFVF